MRHCKSTVWLEDDDAAFLCAETPHEVVEMIQAALDNDKRFVQLTSGNDSDWNGKPIMLRADIVRSVAPPMDQNND